MTESKKVIQRLSHGDISLEQALAEQARVCGEGDDELDLDPRHLSEVQIVQNVLIGGYDLCSR